MQIMIYPSLFMRNFPLTCVLGRNLRQVNNRHSTQRTQFDAFAFLVGILFYFANCIQSNQRKRERMKMRPCEEDDDT